jgi:hypothetical protein
VRYDDSWVHPARTTEQTMCRAGADCHLPAPALIMACVAIQGFCRSCALKRGIKALDDDGPSSVQLSLEGPWDA